MERNDEVGKVLRALQSMQIKLGVDVAEAKRVADESLRIKRIGSVVEWADRTGEVHVEQELADLLDAAVQGDFSRRLNLEGKEGFFRQLAEGMNKLVDIVSSGLGDLARVLNAIAKGELTERIDAHYSGTFGQLKEDTNATVERLREPVSRIKEAADAICAAAGEIATGNSDLSSRTEEQASSLDQSATSMEELNATVKQNAENARQVNELAKSSNDIASKGGEIVKRVVITMGSIQEYSKKTADIIGVIDSIAFQTHPCAQCSRGGGPRRGTGSRRARCATSLSAVPRRPRRSRR